MRRQIKRGIFVCLTGPQQHFFFKIILMSSSTLLTTCECRWTNPLLTHYRSPHLRTSARPLKLMLMTHGSSYGCLCECGSDSNCLAIRRLNNVSFNVYPFKMQLEMNSGLGLNLGGCCSFFSWTSLWACMTFCPQVGLAEGNDPTDHF